MTQPLADPGALLTMARRDARALSFHLVLLGVACLVAVLLATSLGRVLGVVLALALLGLVAVALARFVAARPATTSRWAGQVRAAWVGAGVAATLVAGGRLLAPHLGWIAWLGGGIGLLAGLATGHLVFYGSRSLAAPATGRTSR